MFKRATIFVWLSGIGYITFFCMVSQYTSILQDSLLSWILQSTSWITDSKYWIPLLNSGTWILDFTRQWDSGFQSPGLLDAFYSTQNS